MTDTTHLNALRLRRSHELSRLARATSINECQLRAVWISQIDKEIADELKFIGIQDGPAEVMTDDELLAELTA